MGANTEGISLLGAFAYMPFISVSEDHYILVSDQHVDVRLETVGGELLQQDAELRTRASELKIACLPGKCPKGMPTLHCINNNQMK